LETTKETDCQTAVLVLNGRVIGLSGKRFLHSCAHRIQEVHLTKVMMQRPMDAMPVETIWRLQEDAVSPDLMRLYQAYGIRLVLAMITLGLLAAPDLRETAAQMECSIEMLPTKYPMRRMGRAIRF
jgi:hypothetical protein